MPGEVILDHNLIVDILGWAGAVILLSAYGLVSVRKLEGDSVPYQLLNLAGGLFLIVNTVYYGAYPSSGVNLVWSMIAILALSKRWWAAKRPADR
jgi:hypothetical protein